MMEMDPCGKFRVVAVFGFNGMIIMQIYIF